jgi:hypothetical protein
MREVPDETRLTQDRDGWLALVRTTMNILVANMGAMFTTIIFLGARLDAVLYSVTVQSNMKQGIAKFCAPRASLLVSNLNKESCAAFSLLKQN